MTTTTASHTTAARGRAARAPFDPGWRAVPPEDLAPFATAFRAHVRAWRALPAARRRWWAAWYQGGRGTLLEALRAAQPGRPRTEAFFAFHPALEDLRAQGRGAEVEAFIWWQTSVAVKRMRLATVAVAWLATVPASARPPWATVRAELPSLVAWQMRGVVLETTAIAELAGAAAAWGWAVATAPAALEREDVDAEVIVDLPPAAPLRVPLSVKAGQAATPDALRRVRWGRRHATAPAAFVTLDDAGAVRVVVPDDPSRSLRTLPLRGGLAAVVDAALAHRIVVAGQARRDLAARLAAVPGAEALAESEALAEVVARVAPPLTADEAWGEPTPVS